MSTEGRIIEYNGVQYASLSVLAHATGVANKYNLLKRRLNKGWSLDTAIESLSGSGIISRERLLFYDLSLMDKHNTLYSRGSGRVEKDLTKSKKEKRYA